MNVDANPASAPAVLFERIGDHIALVTLNRPSVRNAVNGEITRGMSAAVAQIESDTSIRVAVLAAAGGKAFSAGADLSEVAAGRGSELATESGGLAGFVKAKRTKPWIAAVQGMALGGGCEFVLACDMIVAGRSSKFGLPEVKRGLLAAAGGAFRIARALPGPLAIEMLTLGGTMDAERAAHFGLINRVVDDAEVVNEAILMAQAVAANAPLSVVESLALAKSAHELTEQQLWQLTDKGAARVMFSEDAKEGMRAFLEKRAPRWAGK